MKESAKRVVRSHFSATNIAYMALFTSLAFVVTFLEFPIFPAAPYLKFDFANVFFLFEGFIFGPVEAIVSIALKELLCFAKSSTGGVGEIANLIMSTAFILIPSIVYRFKKGRWWVLLYLAAGSVMQIAVSLPVNRFINFPFFMGEGAKAAFDGAWYYVLAFNAIKSVVISAVVFFVYKPLSRLIKLTREKIEKRSRRVVVKEEQKEEPSQENMPSSEEKGDDRFDKTPEEIPENAEENPPQNG